MMKVLVGNQIDVLKWDNLIDEAGNANFFQTYACYKFYQSLSFLQPIVMAIEEQNELHALVCGYVIADGSGLKSMMTKRAIIPGGIVAKNSIDKKYINELLNQLIVELQTQRAIYIEFRNYNGYDELKDVFKRCGFEYQPHLNFHITIDTAESALLKLNSTKRRDIKTSHKNGVTWELSRSESEMKEYYAILMNLYETRIKTPLFPLEFFIKLIMFENGRFLVVKYQNKVIGGSVCVEMPSRVLYEWFVCGLDGMFKNIYPSTVATWAAIEWAANNGISRFDMMGAGKPDEAYGVREFKSKFGGELVEHGRFLHVLNPLLYSFGKMAVKILKSKAK